MMKQVPHAMNEKIHFIMSLARGEEGFQEHSYVDKIKHFKSIIDYLNNTIQNWATEITTKIDSPNFQWIEMQPIIGNPSHIIQYVTRVPLFIHLASAIFCLGASSLYHLFKDLDAWSNHILARLDYAGVVLLIAGSNTPPIYYSFYCEELENLRMFYLGLMYSMCFTCFVVLLVPAFDKPRFIPLRGALFVIIGLSSAFPVIHLQFLTQEYIMQFIPNFDHWPWAIGGALYIIGAIFYVVKFPEKLFPRKFDYCGSSHNILHSFVMVAGLLHYWASI
mmetsp:Transcript_3874/g.3803  ORF Transcript_3874/g.3803 Transcript_3874/m.3803 type:complete len:277 (-) Transcript_3874:103-933(-)